MKYNKKISWGISLTFIFASLLLSIIELIEFISIIVLSNDTPNLSSMLWSMWLILNGIILVMLYTLYPLLKKRPSPMCVLTIAFHLFAFLIYSDALGEMNINKIILNLHIALFCLSTIYQFGEATLLELEAKRNKEVPTKFQVSVQSFDILPKKEDY